MPDTLKAQHIARLTAGFVLYSDMGRMLCSVTGDTVGWHDPHRRLLQRRAGGREVRRGALPGVPQRVSPQRPATASWWNLASGAWARATWRRT